MDMVDERIFDFAYRMALDDAIGQAAYRSRSEGSKAKLHNCTDAKDAVRAYIEGIFEGCERPGFEETTKGVMGAFGAFLNQEGDGRFTFGNAQKLINMTVKYMFMSTFQKPELKKRFSRCHCPMDSILLEKVAQEAGRAVDKGKASDALQEFANVCSTKRPRKHDWVVKEDLKWSQLAFDDKRYALFQDAVRELAGREGLSPIEFDFFAWANESSRHGRKATICRSYM